MALKCAAHSPVSVLASCFAGQGAALNGRVCCEPVLYANWLPLHLQYAQFFVSASYACLNPPERRDLGYEKLEGLLLLGCLTIPSFLLCHHGLLANC